MMGPDELSPYLFAGFRSFKKEKSRDFHFTSSTIQYMHVSAYKCVQHEQMSSNEFPLLWKDNMKNDGRGK